MTLSLLPAGSQFMGENYCTNKMTNTLFWDCDIIFTISEYLLMSKLPTFSLLPSTFAKGNVPPCAVGANAGGRIPATMKKTLTVLFVITSPLWLSGCPVIIAAGGAGTAMVINDKRSTGTFIEDETLELKVRQQISAAMGDKTNISITSYNQRILLTGQAPTPSLRKKAATLAASVDQVRRVDNQIEIAGPSSLTSRAADVALTARTKAELCSLQVEGFSCLSVKIVTEKGVVYLLGLVSREQAATAILTAQNMRGVLKVVTAFDYTN